MYSLLDSKTALDIFYEIEAIRERLKNQSAERNDKFFYIENMQINNNNSAQLEKLEHYLANRIMDKSTALSIEYLGANEHQKQKIFDKWNKIEQTNEKWVNDINSITRSDIAYIDSIEEQKAEHIQNISITTYFVNMKTGQYISEAKYRFKDEPFKNNKKEIGAVAIGLGSMILVTTIVTALAFSFVGAALVFGLGVLISAAIASKLGQIKGRKAADYLKKHHSPTLFKTNRLDEKTQHTANTSSKLDCGILKKFENESINDDARCLTRY